MIGDTTPDAARAQWKALASLTGEQRLRLAIDLTDFVLGLQAEGRRKRGEAPSEDAESVPAQAASEGS